MSEQLLDDLMHLFAILAVAEGVKEEEVQVVREFLYQQLNRSSAEEYLQRFHKYCEKAASENTQQVARDVNSHLTQKQKVVVVVRLVEMMNADNDITQKEHDICKLVAQTLGLATQEFEQIYTFIVDTKPYLFTDDNVIRIGAPLPADSGVDPRLHVVRDHYPGYCCILHIRSVNTFIVQYYGDGDLKINGLGINAEWIYFLAPGSVIRSRGQAPVYYSDIVSRFFTNHEVAPTVFEASAIEYRFPGGKIGLRNVSIKEEGGRLIGLMGASGAGKSTLLNVLNGNYIPNQGKVTINGINIHHDKTAIEGVIGYVSQDDLLIEELTVFQNLFYNAKLCFSQMSEQEISDLVMSLLSDLGLSEAAHLQVGNPLQKKISGGQRKRLNIALELIREPQVLFVDEPTSGLSSRDSENIMDLLKELSLRGKMIFVVIHQPSSDIFKMFDKLYILDVGGYPIYYGNPVEAVTYFKRRAELINADYSECEECGNVNPEQIFNIIESKVIDENGNFTHDRKFTPMQWNEMFHQHIEIPQVQPSEEPPYVNLHIPNRLRQMQVFIKRDVLAKLANTAYLAINFLEAPILAIILAFILRYYNEDVSNALGYHLYDNLNLPAYIFICILVALFMGLTVSAEEILRDRKILKREKFLNLSRRAYLLSKIAVLFTISAIQTLSFVLLGNWIMGIEGMTLAYWFALFTVSCFANMLGLNISATFDNAVTIYILIPILLIPQIILSGVIVKFDKLNPALASRDNVPLAGDLMASRWAYEALAVHQFQENPYEKHFYKYDKLMSEAQYMQTLWLNKLSGKLDYVDTHHATDSLRPEIESTLALLRHELQQEAGHFVFADGTQPKFGDLTVDRFTGDTADEIRDFLSLVRRHYINQYKDAEKERNKVVRELNERAVDADLALATGSEEWVRIAKLLHHNEALENLVTNHADENKILEIDNALIQNTDPVYLDAHDDEHNLYWGAHFFAANKHFLGMYFSTFAFNLGMIWLMSLIMYATLYYEAFRKLFNRIADLTKPSRYKRV